MVISLVFSSTKYTHILLTGLFRLQVATQQIRVPVKCCESFFFHNAFFRGTYFIWIWIYRNTKYKEMYASGEYIHFFSSPLSTSFPRTFWGRFFFKMISYCSFFFLFYEKFIRTRKLWKLKLLAICVIDVYFQSFANLCAYILWQITDGLVAHIECTL